MKNIMTPTEAYNRVAKLAKKDGVSPSKYAEKRQIGRYILSDWKTNRTKSVRLEHAQKLGIV